MDLKLEQVVLPVSGTAEEPAFPGEIRSVLALWLAGRVSHWSGWVTYKVLQS